MVFIADMTRAYLASAQNLIKSLRSKLSANDSIVIIINPNQAALFEASPFPIIQTNRNIPLTKTIESVIEDAVSKGSSARVYSFHAFVLGLKPYIAEYLRNNVEFSHWLTLTNMGSTSAPLTDHNPDWPFARISKNDALESLVNGLNDAGAVSQTTAISKTELREAISYVDRRFRRKHPETAEPGLISAMIREALAAGTISNEMVEADERIWLRIGDQTPRPQSSPTHSDFADTSMPTQPNRNSSINSLGGSFADSASKLDRFATALGLDNLGPYPNVRPLLLDALEANADKAMPIQDLICKCIGEAKDKLDAEAIGTGKPINLSWEKVRHFFERLLARIPVLKSADGTVVGPSFQSFGQQIVGLRDNWRDALEGAVLLFVLERVSTIDYFSDISELTRQLHSRRDTAHREIVLRALSYLTSNGFAQSDSGGIRISISSPHQSS